MKKIFKPLLLVAYIFVICACEELDLASLDKANSEVWYASKDHFRYSLNDLYRATFFKKIDPFDRVLYDDDVNCRTNSNDVKNGTVDSEWGTAANWWAELYKGVSRSNTIMDELNKKGDVLGENLRKQFMGEAQFVKAYVYGQLTFLYGDVPYFEENISIEESYTVGRTDQNTVKQKVYDLFDAAVGNLPASYDGVIYATKGTALACKARIALYLGDYDVAKTAAKACMDLNVYELHPDFADLFYSKTKVSKELIFTFPRSTDFDDWWGTNWLTPRNHKGGWAANNPTWQLLASATCIDGLPIDESPLFDSHNPFLNRDPRIVATIIPFGKLSESDTLGVGSPFNFYGIDYNPYPPARMVMNYITGELMVNKDVRSIGAYASFNGLILRKGVDWDWLDDARTDAGSIVCRYGEVLLTYAEAAIELNEIDASVLNVLNDIRERGYAGSGIDHPEITTTNQAELRNILRTERRVEMAFEGYRYFDLIRWRLAEKVLVGKNYGLPTMTQSQDLSQPLTGDLITNVVEPGNWFWGITPEIDEDGIPDFQALEDAGLTRVLSVMTWDKSKQYLFPIPNSNRKLNENLTQNPGY